MDLTQFSPLEAHVGYGRLGLCGELGYEGGRVHAAIDRIEAAGYGVTRLWTASAGAQEDDRLGLAVIENRRRGAR